MGNKILLVDDDDLILMTFADYLGQEGFEVETAESGEGAIEMLDKNSPYDLVITDLRMYGETGVDVFNKALEVNESIHVIIITAFGGEAPLLKEALQLKPCRFAFKPFSEDELLDKVRICLGKIN